MVYFMEYHVYHLQVIMEEEAKGWLVACSFSSIAPTQPKSCRPPCHGRGGAFLSPVFLLLLLLPAGLAQHHLLPEQGDVPLCQTVLVCILDQQKPWVL